MRMLTHLARALALGLVLALAPVTAAPADPATTGTVAGTLADGATPVADATVELLILPYGVPVRQTRTDAAGAFRFAEVPPRDYTLRFRLPGGLTQFHPGVTELAAATPFAVTAGAQTTIREAVMPHGTIGGRITTDSGAPAPGARVELHRITAGAPLATVLTDANGDYRINYPPNGQHRIAVAAAERGATLQWAYRQRSYTQATPVTITPGQHSTVDERLFPTGTINGRFTRDGVPVANVVVYAYSQTSSAESVSNWTAPDGTFRLRPYPGSYKLKFVVPSGTGLDQWLGGAESESATQPVRIAAGQELTLDERQLPFGLVGGELTDATGQPAARDAVVVYDDARGRQFVATTADDGSWFKMVWPGTYHVRYETGTQTQWENRKRSAATADPVVVTANAKTLIDEVLFPASATATVSRTNAADTASRLDAADASRLNAADSLRDRYAARGRHIGAAALAYKLGDSAYTGILDREFGSLTPETELEWDSVEPRPGQFVFTAADRLVAHARANDMTVRGRSLIAPSNIHSAWFGNLGDAASVQTAMTRHITGVLAHYQGQVSSWGVVTEAFTETGALRRSRFEMYLGRSFIEQAFRAARAVDPTATLCYSDYNIDDFTKPKTQAVYAMVRDFKARGVPIDCVGLQSHFTATNPVPSDYQRTLAEFAALGVQVQISELDIAGSGATQAESYRRVALACLATPRCSGLTVWGVRDIDSWRSGETPLLFDAAGNPKPAYYSVLNP